MPEEKKDNKSKPIQHLLDTMSMMMKTETVHGMARSSALKQNKCVKCGKDASKFKDGLSMKEYLISGFCQKCQDEFFD